MGFLIFWIYQKIIELKNLFMQVLAAFMEFKKNIPSKKNLNR